MRSGNLLHHWKAFNHAIALSPDDKIFAGIAQDKTIHMVDLVSFDEIFRFKHADTTDNRENPCCALAFSPDGHSLVVGCGRTVELWTRVDDRGRAWKKQWSYAQDHEGRSVCSLGFVGQQHDVTVGYFRGSVTTVLNNRTGTYLYHCASLKYLTASCISNNGSMLATAINGFSDQVRLFRFDVAEQPL